MEHYRRESDGSPRYQLLGTGAVLRLSGEVVVGVDAIYAGAFELPYE